MESPKRYVKLPVEVTAIQFTGENFDAVQSFVGNRSANWNEKEEVSCFNHIGTYLPNTPTRNAYATAELWVAANNQWLPIDTGEWILKDELGCYPCKDSRFQEIYTEACTCEEPPTFEQELMQLINHHSMENHSGTPDYILAAFLRGVLHQFDCAVMGRAVWRGESVELPATQRLGGEDVTSERTD